MNNVQEAMSAEHVRIIKYCSFDWIILIIKSSSDEYIDSIDEYRGLLQTGRFYLCARISHECK